MNARVVSLYRIQLAAYQQGETGCTVLLLVTSPQSHLRKARRLSAYKKNSKLLNPHSPMKCRSSPNGNRAAANGGVLAAGKATVLMVVFVRFST